MCMSFVRTSIARGGIIKRQVFESETDTISCLLERSSWNDNFGGLYRFPVPNLTNLTVCHYN